MPNELFGSVGFALSADRRRPKTLAPRLTKAGGTGKLKVDAPVFDLLKTLRFLCGS